jgi:hypothetical protein
MKGVLLLLSLSMVFTLIFRQYAQGTNQTMWSPETYVINQSHPIVTYHNLGLRVNRKALGWVDIILCAINMQLDSSSCFQTFYKHEKFHKILSKSNFRHHNYTID